MKKQFKILLAGYGDIASRAAGVLLAQGHRVFGMRRTPQLDDQSEVELVSADLREAVKMEALLSQRFDVVVISVTPDAFSDAGYRNGYVAAAASFVSAVNKCLAPPGLVIWVSSTSVYGQRNGEWVNEDSPTVPEKIAGKRLLEAEGLVTSLPKSIKTVVVRFSGIYGPGRHRLLNQVREGGIAPAEPAVWSNRIHSEDCAGVLTHLIELYRAGQDVADLYLATDCMPVTLHEVQQWLAIKLGVQVCSSGSTPVRGNRRCSNQRLLRSGYQFRYPTYREGYSD